MTYIDHTSAEVVGYWEHPNNGPDIATLVLKFPRFILAEFNTHGTIAKNSASSRAVPVLKQVREVLESPFVPQRFFRNQSGMSASEPLSDVENLKAQRVWFLASRDAIESVLSLTYGADQVVRRIRHERRLRELCGADIAALIDALQDQVDPQGVPNIHKQWVSRLLEPYMWHKVIATCHTSSRPEFRSSGWANFLDQRLHAAVQPEMRTLAEKIEDALMSPVTVSYTSQDGYTLPFVNADEAYYTDAPSIAAARCARVSYLNHDGIRSAESDRALYDKLVSAAPMHASPLEHVLRPAELFDRPSRVPGWSTLRHDIERRRGSV